MREKMLEIKDLLEVTFDESDTTLKYQGWNELIGFDIAFIINGFHYKIFINKKQNVLFDVCLRDSKTKTESFEMNQTELNTKNAEEICYEIEKEIKKVRMKTTFMNGGFYRSNQFLTHFKFKNLNIDFGKLKKELKNKLNANDDDHLELMLHYHWEIEYEEDKKIFHLTFYCFSEGREKQIHLNDIRNK